MRNAVANELKLTFTLPRPGEGLTEDALYKASGVGGFVTAAYIASAGVLPQYAEKMSDAELLFAERGFPASIAALGATVLFAANRVRFKSKQA